MNKMYERGVKETITILNNVLHFRKIKGYTGTKEIVRYTKLCGGNYQANENEV